MQDSFLDLSIIIITFNEEQRLPRCLASLPKGCELIVLDSGSQDQSRSIAEAFGATVKTHPFDHYAAQKNRALELASRTWVFSIDADEQMDESLSRSLAEFVRNARSVDRGCLFSVRRQLVFMGRKMRFGQTIDWPLRLFPREGVRFDGKVHEQIHFVGGVRSQKKRLSSSGTLLHYSYQDLSDYFTKFNRYTSLIAEAKAANAKTHWLGYALFLRPGVQFIYRYLLCLGILDGYPGYVYALLSSFYSFVKYAKLEELKSLSAKGMV